MLRGRASLVQVPLVYSPALVCCKSTATYQYFKTTRDRNMSASTGQQVQVPAPNAGLLKLAKDIFAGTCGAFSAVSVTGDG